MEERSLPKIRQKLKEAQKSTTKEAQKDKRNRKRRRRCYAKYDHIGDPSQNELRFKRGDKLVVVKMWPDSPWFLAAHSVSRQKGFVPLDFVFIGGFPPPFRSLSSSSSSSLSSSSSSSSSPPISSSSSSPISISSFSLIP